MTAYRCPALFIAGVLGLSVHGVSADRLPIEAAHPSVQAPSGRTAPAAPRAWATERPALDGPSLGPTWFAGRRAVVYLVPVGERRIARRAASAVMRECWSAGDWSLTQVFVCAVRGRLALAAGRRTGLRDMAAAVTEETGQGPEYESINEERLRETVLFVHDPEMSAWPELLGPDTSGAPVTAAVLLDGGRVVRVVKLEADPPDVASEAEPAGPTHDGEEPATRPVRPADRALASDVRRLLPDPQAGQQN